MNIWGVMGKVKALLFEVLESDPEFSAQVEADQTLEPEIPAPAPEDSVHSDEIPF